MPFQIIRDDITRVRADAIVDTANPEVRWGSGTDGAIYRAAGEQELLAARKKIGKIAPGEAAVTPAFRLHAKYIIHTVGPAWRDGKHGEAEILASCYRKSLALAEQLGCRSIAFPLISAGAYGFPKDLALETALSVIREYLNGSDMEVILVVFERESLQLAAGLENRVAEYIDEKYVAKRFEEEYGGRPNGNAAVFRRRRMEQSGETSVLREPPTAGEIPDEADGKEGFRNTHRLKTPLAPGEKTDKAEGSVGVQNASRLQEPPTSGTADKGSRSGFRPKKTSRCREPITALEPDLMESDDAYLAENIGSSYVWENAETRRPERPSRASNPRIQEKRTLEDAVNHLGESFQARLFRMIDERKMTDAEVYKGANIDRKLFSKIRCSTDYIPKKKTIVALAIALKLNLDDTKDLLASAGLALTNNSKFDVIISFCIENGIYNIFEVNALLFQFDQPILG